jgi:uncharacterized protein
MNCPKCNGAMDTVRVDEFEVDRCASCEGLWFDLREHEHLRNIKGSTAKLDTGDPAMGRKMDVVRDVQCPRCQVKMVKLAFPEQPHIRYEQCATCGGAFLDAGEFSDWKSFSLAERVRSFLAPLRK